MKTEEYLKLYVNELTNALKITDAEFERKRYLLDLMFLSLLKIFKKEEMRLNVLGIENVIVLEDEKTITYVIDLRRPGLFIGVKGTTIEAVVKGMKEIGLSKIKNKKEIKIKAIIYHFTLLSKKVISYHNS